MFLLFLFCFSNKKINPLQPFFAKEISDIIKEPSGASYCNTTNSIWIICDKPSCNYIYELDLQGDLLHEWKFTKKHHDDSEAVVCDDINQLLYMGEEGYMRITSFILPIVNNTSTYTIDDDEFSLIELDQIDINIDDLRNIDDDEDEDDLPGLEGLTLNHHNNTFIIANEKEPSLIISLSLNGDIIQSNKVKYADDLSGLAYDDQLGLLWVLSDQSEQVYITNIAGDIIYDYWDLPMENPEGIAINNIVNPPEMYIVTDPSSPHGKQYISAYFKFTKPIIGTGRNYYSEELSSPISVECDGCDEVWELVDELSTLFISPGDNTSNKSSKSTETDSIITPYIIIGTILCFCIVFIIFSILFIKYKMSKRKYDIVDKNEDNNNDNDNDNDNDEMFTPPTIIDKLKNMFPNIHLRKQNNEIYVDSDYNIDINNDI